MYHIRLVLTFGCEARTTMRWDDKKLTTFEKIAKKIIWFILPVLLHSNMKSAIMKT